MLSFRIFKERCVYSHLLKQLYHTNVIDHYENPRNVGSFDSKDNSIGTGLVGAPACIRGDTSIAVADGRRSVFVEKLYLENKIVKVWSYNTYKSVYEIKNAAIIKNNFKKSMKKIILDDNSFIFCTDDHKFLLKNNTYLEVNNINNALIVPFTRILTNSGYWKINNNFIKNNKIKKIEYIEGEYDCYDLQVEENNNFAVITKETNNIHNGIIIKNCGDVMKIQIRVKDGIVTDSAFKVFGCGSAIASSSLATEWVKGSNIDDALKISNRDIAKHLRLPPVKNHCSMLSEDAIKAAIKDYKKKNNIE